MGIQRLYGVSDVARCLGVKANEVLRWTNSPPPKFPLPVAVLGPKGNTPLWQAEQIPALRDWLAKRLNVSAPEAHWARVDRGEKHPGDHEDQMAMFPVQPQTPAEPDGLFPVEGGIS